MTPSSSSPDRVPNARLADVRALMATLKTRRDRTESDRRIATHVYIAFEKLGRTADVQGLHFYVFEGAVSVYGDVLTHEQRDRVLLDLAALPGVRRVADHLRVADRRPKRPFTIRPVALETEPTE
ncbi:MAG: BON domain-containing protein [Rhodothermales bacterium]